MNLRSIRASDGRLVSVNRPISTQLFPLSESLSETLFERVRLSELHFPLPLYNLPELPASSTDRGTGLSGPTLQRLWDSITGGMGGGSSCLSSPCSGTVCKSTLSNALSPPHLSREDRSDSEQNSSGKSSGFGI